MPIEIKELHVRVQVQDEPRQPQRVTPGRERQQQDRIVRACVEEVLAILKRKEQR